MYVEIPGQPLTGDFFQTGMRAEAFTEGILDERRVFIPEMSGMGRL